MVRDDMGGKEEFSKPPVGVVFFEKIAVGHGNEHPGRRQSPITNLEQLTVAVSKRQGPLFQAFDVSLEHQCSVLIAVKGVGEPGGDMQAGRVLAVQDDLVARERHVLNSIQQSPGVLVFRTGREGFPSSRSSTIRRRYAVDHRLQGLTVPSEERDAGVPRAECLLCVTRGSC